MSRCNKLLAAMLAIGLAGAPAHAPAHAQDADEEAMRDAPPAMALMGTIPIYWGENDGFSDILNGTARPHWARPLLERAATLAPLDYLSRTALAGHGMLLMAQPRGLSGEENVALDEWVRGGGRLLLFADPLMTGESAYGIGDRRRPQDTVLLSPILSHWGLELMIDAAQPEGDVTVLHQQVALPVNMRGTWRLMRDDAPCLLAADGLLARCALGEGEALLVADGAMLDLAATDPRAVTALDWLLEAIFPQFGDNAGPAAKNGVPSAERAPIRPKYADSSEVGEMLQLGAMPP